MYGDAQVVGPVKLDRHQRQPNTSDASGHEADTHPVSPHWAYCAAVAPLPGLAAAVDAAATVVAAAAVDVAGATVVGLAGLAEDDATGLEEPEQLKTSGPGTV